MTLQQFFSLLSANPDLVLAYFVFVPVVALVVGLMSRREGHLAPWKYIYSLLVYLVCIPGVFVVSLSIYQFLFERGSVYSADIITQVVPVLSMIVTLFIIRKFVALANVPGFGRVSGLFMMTLVMLLFMWGLDNTRLYFVAFTKMPFYFVIGIFVAVFLFFRMGFTRLTK